MVEGSEVGLREKLVVVGEGSWKRSNGVRPLSIRAYISLGSRTPTFVLSLDRIPSLLTPTLDVITITPLTHSLASPSCHMSPSFANLSPISKTSHNPLNPYHVSVIDAPFTNPMPYASIRSHATPFGVIYIPELTRLADPALRRQKSCV